MLSFLGGLQRGSERQRQRERAKETQGGRRERECASSERDLWVQFISITFHSLGLYFVVVCFCCIWFFIFVVVFCFFCSKITKEKETSNIAFKAALCTYFFVLTDLTFQIVYGINAHGDGSMTGRLFALYTIQILTYMYIGNHRLCI